MIRTGLFRFVPYASIHEFEMCGWMIVRDLGPVHGFWSCLMWRCDCVEAA
mgnify:CR=1 FL=1